jgi:hypothetical protein
MTRKNARKVAARERQAKVGGKYMTHLAPKEKIPVSAEGAKMVFGGGRVTPEFTYLGAPIDADFPLTYENLAPYVASTLDLAAPMDAYGFSIRRVEIKEGRVAFLVSDLRLEPEKGVYAEELRKQFELATKDPDFKVVKSPERLEAEQKGPGSFFSAQLSTSLLELPHASRKNREAYQHFYTPAGYPSAAPLHVERPVDSFTHLGVDLIEVDGLLYRWEFVQSHGRHAYCAVPNAPRQPPKLNYKAAEFLVEYLRWLRVHGLEQEGGLLTQTENNILGQAEKRVDDFLGKRDPDVPKNLRPLNDPTTLKVLNIRAAWMNAPKALRCIHPKDRLIGITDGEHTSWIPLTETMGVPEFGRWWKNLPKAEPYDRAF